MQESVRRNQEIAHDTNRKLACSRPIVTVNMQDITRRIISLLGRKGAKDSGRRIGSCYRRSADSSSNVGPQVN